jgi:hypothetical protein
MTCAKDEICRTYEITDPTTTATNLVLDTIPEFSKMSIYNESDQPFQIDYKDVSGNSSTIIVPATRNFTRIMNAKLNPSSLYRKSLVGPATGKVYIILGN